jgi:hypothetical protein
MATPACDYRASDYLHCCPSSRDSAASSRQISLSRIRRLLDISREINQIIIVTKSGGLHPARCTPHLRGARMGLRYRDISASYVMNLFQIMSISAAILTSVGGASAIILGMSSWLGKVWADRLMRKETRRFTEELEGLKNQLLMQSETHKLRLRKSEILFQKELDAVSAFSTLYRGLQPTYQYPDMDADDYSDHIAIKFESTEASLMSYPAEYDIVLEDAVIQLIERCINLCGIYKYEATMGNASHSAREAAKELVASMLEARNKLIFSLKNQAAT